MVSMSDFVKPLALSKGDIVGVIAPSDAIERKYIKAGVKLIQEWGLKVKLGKHLFSQVGDFAAGTPEERREDILKMIDDQEVKVIWSAEGGYAATEVLPVFTKDVVQKLRQSPKWFIGYSDVCILLNALMSFRIVSIQGPNFSGLADKDFRSQDWLRRMLFGETGLEIGSESNWKSFISGTAEGTLIVSNLDSLVATLGTRFDPLMHGSGDLILGIEEWWIEKSTLQRQVDMILNHKRANRIKGILLGRLVAIDEYSYPEWGRKVTPEALVEGRLRLRSLNMPMAQLLDFGHELEPNWLEERFPKLQKPHRFLGLPNGIRVKFTVDAASGRLQFLEPITGEKFVSVDNTLKQ